MLSLKKGKVKETEISEDEEIAQMTEEAVPKPAQTGASIGADIERLKAQIDAINEMRKSYSEKFTHIAEQIGELRNMLIEKEKDIRNIEVKAVHASDLVESVQPEKLLIEIKKEDVKIEAIKSKLESYGIIAEKIREELKEIRDKMNTFRGIDQVVEMNKEVKDNLSKMKKIQSSVEIHSDKVENIFGIVEKRFDDYKKYEELSNTLNEAFQEMVKEFNDIKTNSKNHITKDEFEKFRADSRKQMVYFDKAITEFKNIMINLQDSHTETVKRVERAEPVVVAERMDSAIGRDEFLAGLSKNKEEILSEIGKAQTGKSDATKAIALVEKAKEAMKNKDNKAVRETYRALKQEYEALSPKKKNELYEDIKRVYDWAASFG